MNSKNENRDLNTADILMKAAENREYECIEIRRDLHAYPEISWTEFRTTAKVAKYLESTGMEAALGTDVISPEDVMDFPAADLLTQHRLRAISQGASPAIIRRIEEKGGYTGAMVTIEGGQPGPTTAFRFDMDCNKVQEPEDEEHLPYQQGFSSKNPGCMHACGHDGHTAMGMVLARILYENREHLAGRVKVIFQPAEEGVKGARAMTAKGILDDVDLVLGMHIYPAEKEYPALAGTQTGLYATRKWTVNLTGRTAHAGGAPQEGNNAILAAVSAISAMNSFLQDGRGVSRLNIGTIEGGTGRNVIAGHCRFEGESRGSETVVEERLFEKVQACVKAAAEMYGCEYTIETVGMSPAGGGDPQLAAQLAEKALQMVPELKETHAVQVNTGTADDFCYMMDRVHKNGGRGCYMALLSRLDAGLHNERYNFDEKILLAGVKTCIAALELSGNLPQKN